MPKIDIGSVAASTSTTYPAAFRHFVAGRERQALGDAAGLTQFGVNLTRLKPGAASSLRHWHEAEDEFVFVVEGIATLVEDGGETELRAGDAAGFKAGAPNAHRLVNRSGSDVVYLEVGKRGTSDRVHFADEDLVGVLEGGRVRYESRDGKPYERG
jgi:uncharacterized cupin superfamily protein